MRYRIYILLVLYSLCVYGCSIVKFTPKTEPVVDTELISALNQVSIKVNPENETLDNLNNDIGYQIYSSHLFKEVKQAEDDADLIITEYSNSIISRECGFMNEAIVYLTLLGYVGICETKYTFNFILHSPKTKDSIIFGPLEYTKKIFAGWFFAPIGLLKGWHIHSDTPPVAGTRDLWFTLLSTKKEDLLKMIEQTKKAPNNPAQ